MIIISRHQLARAYRTMRTNRKLTQHQLATRLHVHQHTISVRENHARLDLKAAIDTAHAFGYQLELKPTRHPHTRPTGTGWPT